MDKSKQSLAHAAGYCFRVELPRNNRAVSKVDLTGDSLLREICDGDSNLCFAGHTWRLPQPVGTVASREEEDHGRLPRSHLLRLRSESR